MGAYDGNPRSEIGYSPDSRSQWGNSNPPIDGAIGNLVDRFSGLGVSGNDPSKESLFQVMKAVEAAETAIKNQMEENNHLKTELQRKTQELEKYTRNIEWLGWSIHGGGPTEGSSHTN